MAHKEAGGSSRNGRDSAGRRLGIKSLVAGSLFQATLLHVSVATNGGRVRNVGRPRSTIFTQSLKRDFPARKGFKGRTFISCGSACRATSNRTLGFKNLKGGPVQTGPFPCPQPVFYKGTMSVAILPFLAFTGSASPAPRSSQYGLYFGDGRAIRIAPCHRLWRASRLASS
jgi:large subunit ribosomal protein L27